jgi:CBS domain-containing protein
MKSECDVVTGLCALSFVGVPPWFTVAAALKVAAAKNVPFVVVEEGAGRVGAVSTAELQAAPPTQLVSRWVRRTPVEVSPQARRHEALALMEAAGTNWLPVRAANVLMGLVTRQSLSANEPAPMAAAA